VEATNSEAVKTVEVAEQALKESWWGKQTLSLYRISVLLKAADLMLLKRNYLSALMMFEAGKTMTEALADVDEAIDFINFYARHEISIQLSHDKFINRGVISVIAPWNFPLAIPCGMCVAPLAAGNAVILKPAEQTPLIAIELHKLLLDAGVPKDIFHLVLGDGEIVGAPLVSHDRTAGVVFTGSKNVGTWIYKHAAKNVINHYSQKMPSSSLIIVSLMKQFQEFFMRPLAILVKNALLPLE
jgi:RHH-type proline utilization regulon transcriptional repressor/proline dehydrogenase/delta 1-pyrroline-5-carboxylate dehydrogenase